MRPCDRSGRCCVKAQHRPLFCLPTLRNVPGPPHTKRKAQSCKAAERFVTAKIPQVIEIPLPGLRQRRPIPSRSFLRRTSKTPLYAGPSLNRRSESGTSFCPASGREGVLPPCHRIAGGGSRPSVFLRPPAVSPGPLFPPMPVGIEAARSPRGPASPIPSACQRGIAWSIPTLFPALHPATENRPAASHGGPPIRHPRNATSNTKSCLLTTYITRLSATILHGRQYMTLFSNGI